MDHEKTPEEKEQKQQSDKKNNKKEKEKAQAAKPSRAKKPSEKLDARTMKILRAVEQVDKGNNKELIKAIVGKQMGGDEGENRW